MQQQRSRRDFLAHSTALIGVGLALGAANNSVATPIEKFSTNRTSNEFAAFQADRRRELWNMLGDLPQGVEPRRIEIIKTEKHEGFTLERLMLNLNGIEPVPALLLIPDKRQPKAPGLLYIHAHGGTYELGSEELLEGRDILQPYAPLCAEKGIVTLAIDSWCFAGRRHTDDGEQEETDAFKRMLWQGQLLWGMMLFDELQAVTYLRSRVEVDPERIGTFGLSMGSLKSWWLAALDPRVSFCADLCCLTDYAELIKSNTLKGYGIYSHVPNLLKRFQSAEINELIVPRPHLSLNGRRDSLAPVVGVERIRNYLLPRYEKYGRKEDCLVELFDCGHEETPAMRAIVSEWFDKYLVDNAIS